MDFIRSLNQQRSKNNAIFLKQISRIFWVQKVIFHTLDLTNWHPPTLPKMRLNARFMLGNENDIASLTTNPHLYEALNNEKVFHKKLQAGHKLLLGKHNDEIVFYLWSVAGKKGLMDKTLDLEKNQVAIEIGFTRKEYRGHGFFIFGINYLFPILQAEGVTSCLTDIATHNLPMVKTALKIGFKSSDSFYYWIHTPFSEYAIPKGSIANKVSRH